MHLSKEDYDTCVKSIRIVADKLEADFANIDELNALDPTAKPMQNKQEEGIVAHFMIRKKAKSVQDLLEIRVAVVGNVDAGKVKEYSVKKKG
jgi:GTPase